MPLPLCCRVSAFLWAGGRWRRVALPFLLSCCCGPVAWPLFFPFVFLYRRLCLLRGWCRRCRALLLACFASPLLAVALVFVLPLRYHVPMAMAGGRRAFSPSCCCAAVVVFFLQCYVMFLFPLVLFFSGWVGGRAVPVAVAARGVASRFPFALLLLRRCGCYGFSV